MGHSIVHLNSLYVEICKVGYYMVKFTSRYVEICALMTVVPPGGECHQIRLNESEGRYRVFEARSLYGRCSKGYASVG